MREKDLSDKIIVSGWDGSLEELFPLEAHQLRNREEETLLPSFCNPLDFEGESPIPIYMADILGNYLFTPGQIHWLYGAPGCYKSFLMQSSVINHGGVYIDLESNLLQVSPRIRSMKPQYYDVDRWAFPDTRERLLSVVNELCKINPTVVAIDTFGRLMTVLGGGSTDNDQDVANVIDLVIKPLTSHGHALLVGDHIPKNAVNTDFPYGSMNKKAQADVTIYVERSQEGDFSTLKITKDRYGIYKKNSIYEGQEYGRIELNPISGRIDVIPKDSETYIKSKFLEGSLRVSQDGVYLALSILGTLSRSEIAHYVGGKNDNVKRAINVLISSGVASENKGKTNSGGIAKHISLTGTKYEVLKTSKNMELGKKLKMTKKLGLSQDPEFGN